MKKLFVILAATLLPVLGMLAQMPAAEQKAAELTLERETHDFGTLKFKSKPTTTEFAFTNTGTAPLVITRSEVSCTCLSIKYPKAPVAPGESGIVYVTYSPKNDLGTFNNTVRIHSNGTQKRVTIFVQGNVVRR